MLAVGTIVSFGQRGLFVVCRAFPGKTGAALHDLLSLDGGFDIFARQAHEMSVLPRPEEAQTAAAARRLAR